MSTSNCFSHNIQSLISIPIHCVLVSYLRILRPATSKKHAINLDHSLCHHQASSHCMHPCSASRNNRNRLPSFRFRLNRFECQLLFHIKCSKLACESRLRSVRSAGASCFPVFFSFSPFSIFYVESFLRYFN